MGICTSKHKLDMDLDLDRVQYQQESPFSTMGEIDFNNPFYGQGPDQVQEQELEQEPEWEDMSLP